MTPLCVFCGGSDIVNAYPVFTQLLRVSDKKKSVTFFLTPVFVRSSVGIIVQGRSHIFYTLLCKFVLHIQNVPTVHAYMHA